MQIEYDNDIDRTLDILR